MSSLTADQLGWRDAVELFKRPQPVTIPMVVLFAIIPLYLVIGDLAAQHRDLHVPEIFLDRLIPLAPAWSVVYGALFLAPLLPVCVVHQQELVRRTILAFLMIWLMAYAVFLAYPTMTSRPEDFAGEGFFAAALRFIYDSDVQYNCFPSLHVAQCYLAMFVVDRVHRGVGKAAFVWATLVALSTLFTKQHYVVDVVGGVFLAWVAYVAALRGFPREVVPEVERRLAPLLATAAFAAYGVAIAAAWLIYTAANL